MGMPPGATEAAEKEPEKSAKVSMRAQERGAMQKEGNERG